VTELQFDAVDAIANWLRAKTLAMDAAIPVAPTTIAATTGRLPDGSAIVVFGHLPAGSEGCAEAAGTNVICLGPETVRRSPHRGQGDGDAPGAVAMIAPEVRAFDSQPKTVTIFGPGEAGAADWSAWFAGGPAASDARPAPVRAPWIVDAA
jgi:hypothetical protein